MDEKSMNTTEEKNCKKPDGIIAFEKLRAKISRGELNAGQNVRESLLAKEFGLSRDAIRIALNLFVGWNVFEYEPFCGYKVKNFTSADIYNWYELRSAIEPIAARRLAMNPAPEVVEKLKEAIRLEEEAFRVHDAEKAGVYENIFHGLIIENCGNDNLSHIHMTALLSAFFFRGCNFVKNNNSKKSTDNNRKVINAHRRILQAIENCDSALAEKEARKHCDAALKDIINYLFLC